MNRQENRRLMHFENIVGHCVMPSLAEKMNMDFFEFMDKVYEKDDMKRLKFLELLNEIGAI